MNTPQTHDYTSPNRCWGHDYCIVSVFGSGESLFLIGWGEGLKAGDYLILTNVLSTTRYEVESIKYEDDPKDMWAATIKFAPR